ncbi:MAG TPA: hypothetical protein VJR22_04960 [Candidatus Nitrosotalea sp.]|nr:hypothetical protein [Candidatus Nitrosotalea sp.]
MKKIASVSIMLILFSGMLVVHPAFAHNFVQNSDADLIAKIQEFKIESKMIANNISNNTLAQWHISKSQEYWGGNESAALSQKDSSLANQISASIGDLYSLAQAQNANSTIANQKADAINQLLDQAESEEISKSSQGNATVQALALVGVITEVLKDYGDAIGSNVDLTNMDNMNASSTGSMQGMSGMSMSKTPIVNMAAYQSAQALTDVSQTMLGNLQTIAPSDASPYLVKAGTALGALKQKIDAQGSGMDVMTIVHVQCHPNLIAAFNIEAVPEFPMPILLVIVSFGGIVIMSRMFSKNR